MFTTTPRKMTHTLRVLARLIGYPDARLRGTLDGLRDALRDEAALSAARLAELHALIDALRRQDPIDTESAYVELFDRGHSTSLHLFEHVHGDSRDRGPAMIDLAQTYDRAGLHLAPGELPDYLPAVLEFASTLGPQDARAFLGETTHILNALFTALIKRDSRYASVIAALIELAGERAQAVSIADDPALDDSWVEPEAFGGCSVQGQARPGTAQPVHIVRKTSVTQGAQS